MIKQPFKNIRKYGFEFLTVFAGVLAAFALSNWNGYLEDRNYEVIILKEIRTGLKQDLVDVINTRESYVAGYRYANYFRDIVLNNPVDQDSLAHHFFYLFRGHVPVQNLSGYRALKSKGLGIIRNDSLRNNIVSLYENTYKTMSKFAEDYAETQFFANYFDDFKNHLAEDFVFDSTGVPKSIKTPVDLSLEEKNILLLDLYEIQLNQYDRAYAYSNLEVSIKKVMEAIEKELNE